MSRLLAKVIGILALSLGLGSVALSANWTPAAHYGMMRHAHYFSAGDPTGTAAAPEIDPAGALSGLTLLLGGLAVIRGSRAKK